MASATVEDYLKQLLRLSLGHGDAPVTTGALADALALTPGTVTTMLKGLARRGLVHRIPYRGVRLTDEGRRLSAAVLRRHRVIETYLVRELGFDWADVHDEAERLEHAASDAVVERMAEVLDDPAFDPHGDPIPRQDGTLPATVGRTLADEPIGAVVRISRIRCQQTTFLRFAAGAGLRPGRIVELRTRGPDDGALTLRRDDGGDVSLSPAQAACIAVADAGTDRVSSAVRPR